MREDAPTPEPGGPAAHRRTVLRSAAGLVLAWLTPHRDASAAQDDESRARPAPGDVLVRSSDPSAAPLTVLDVPTGGEPVVAWAMSPATRVIKRGSRLNRLVLVGLDPDTLVPATRARAAGGVVAYSAICTHSGCEVGDFLPDEGRLYCECHQTRFDPHDGARVTDGPAPRPLPALPLAVDEGRLIVAAPFTARPGFEQG
ncbi:MAG: ubiquinol-cytochrome c reductase iron-sulfur subunit [Vicinamibacterales bacterium]